jgi:K(+)-stimulated pyrophosphate-energized sodium pump
MSVAAELSASVATVSPPKGYATKLPKELRRVVTPVASVLMRALMVGMSSSLLPVVMTFLVILWTGSMSSSFGVTVGALSVVATCPMAMCFNAMQPVLSSALSIMQMTEHTDRSVARAKANAAIGLRVSNTMHGFTAGASAIVSFSLFIASARIFEVESIDLMLDPQVLPGLLLGSVMPFVFSALTMMTLSTVSKNMYHHVSCNEADAQMNLEHVRAVHCETESSESVAYAHGCSCNW